jgi:hypothetical protein
MIGIRERKRRIAVVNTILPLFNETVRMELRGGRIFLIAEWKGYRGESPAILNDSAGSLRHYRKLGFGGTHAQATAMLVRWETKGEVTR